MLNTVFTMVAIAIIIFTGQALLLARSAHTASRAHYTAGALACGAVSNAAGAILGLIFGIYWIPLVLGPLTGVAAFVGCRIKDRANALTAADPAATNG